jgi:hypothetical protein
VFVGVPWYGYGYGYPWYGYGYPYWYGYPYAGYAGYAGYGTAVAEAAPVYVQQQTAPQYWYYCPGPPAAGYYPYVRECSTNWVLVAPQPAPRPDAR